MKDEERIKKLKAALAKLTKENISRADHEHIVQQMGELESMQEILIEENRKIKEQLVSEQKESYNAQQ
jgi:hypothetical protein